MKILITHLGSLAQNIVASSVIKGITRKVEKPEITWVVTSKDEQYIFHYNKNVKRVFCWQELRELNDTFDLLVNLHPDGYIEECHEVKVKDVLGFKCDDFTKYDDLLMGNTQNTNLSLFQMYYRLTGLVWRGEGYQIGYYPKTKSKRNRIGLAVAHANLRNYVYDELKQDFMKIWHIPYKKNIFKYMDQINKCHKIITDDFTTFHLAMTLRKYVYFLRTSPLNMKLELFGNGEIYKVPNRVFQ